MIPSYPFDILHDTACSLRSCGTYPQKLPLEGASKRNMQTPSWTLLKVKAEKREDEVFLVEMLQGWDMMRPREWPAEMRPEIERSMKQWVQMAVAIPALGQWQSTQLALAKDGTYGTLRCEMQFNSTVGDMIFRFYSQVITLQSARKAHLHCQ